MKNSKDLLKKIDEYFENMNLTEELAQLSNLFSDNFFIQGEETEDLKEALHRAPDSLIDLIIEKITDKDDDYEMSREEKEETLYTDIQEYFRERFDMLPPDKFKKLLCVMNQYPLDIVEASSMMEEFVPYGWVFSFTNGQDTTFVMMKEIQDILATYEDNPAVLEILSFMHGMRTIITAAVGLYGVCTLDQIKAIYLQENHESEDTEKSEDKIDIEKVFEDSISYFEEEGIIWLDGEYIISSFFETERDYRRLLRIQNGDYYVPTIDDVKIYGSGKLLVKDQSYERVFKLLCNELKDQDEAEDMLEDIAASVTRNDWEVPDVMDQLYDWYVAFESDFSTKKFMEALSEWLYGIRRWSECGHSKKELLKPNENLKYVNHTGQRKKEAVQKVYPNDPCPCGSGKKYKKCCGRK